MSCDVNLMIAVKVIHCGSRSSGESPVILGSLRRVQKTNMFLPLMKPSNLHISFPNRLPASMTEYERKIYQFFLYHDLVLVVRKFSISS